MGVRSSPTQWNCAVDEPTRSIEITARHTSELVDSNGAELCDSVRTHGPCASNSKGGLLRDMEVCRLGLIVLHPVDALIGAEITARVSDGETTFDYMRHFAPQPITDGIPGAITAPFSNA